ncbi:MAG: hypothetical protein BWY05_00993 [Euryarchaeota archaeon ADurb.Bin165]|nr:MAG: hypothetical protein BWY05_00993 [Euryarchaeota archaeon ADurb.Bin165]
MHIPALRGFSFFHLHNTVDIHAGFSKVQWHDLLCRPAMPSYHLDHVTNPKSLLKGRSLFIPEDKINLPGLVCNSQPCNKSLLPVRPVKLLHTREGKDFCIKTEEGGLSTQATNLDMGTSKIFYNQQGRSRLICKVSTVCNLLLYKAVKLLPAYKIIYQGIVIPYHRFTPGSLAAMKGFLM